MNMMLSTIARIAKNQMIHHVDPHQVTGVEQTVGDGDVVGARSADVAEERSVGRTQLLERLARRSGRRSAVDEIRNRRDMQV